MGNAFNEKSNKNNSGHARSVMRHKAAGSRILRTITVGNREFSLHATKGWRSSRVTKSGA